MLLAGLGKISYVCLDTNACIQYLHQQLDIQERPISMASVRFVLQLLRHPATSVHYWCGSGSESSISF